MANVGIVLILFLCASGVVSGSKYYIKETNVTSENAPSLCSLATPDIIYTESGTRLNVTTNEIFPADSEKFWVGYVKAFEAFQYRVEYSTNSTGSKDSAEYHCLQLEPKENQLEWSNCSNEYRCLCELASSGGTTPGPSYNNWSTAMQNCLKTGNLPGKRTTNYPRGQGSRYWIGEIRSQVIKAQPANSVDKIISWGYIELRKGEFHLHFGETGEEHGAMCLSESTGTTEVRSPVTSTDSTTDSTTTKSTGTTEVRSPVSSTDSTTDSATTKSKRTAGVFNTESTTDSSTRSIAQLQKGPKTIIVCLAVAVPVILITVIVVAAFCILKNRRTSRSKTRETHTEPQATCNEDDCNPDTARHYFVLEPITSERNCSLPPTENIDYELVDELTIKHGPEDEDDDTYNQASDRGRRIKESGNVYNRADDRDNNDADNTYNHTSDKQGQVKGTENVYDKTEPDEMYNHIGRNKSHKTATDNVYSTTQSDDIYNRTDEAVGRNVKTDNVYGTTTTCNTHNNSDR